ncbi:Type I restriction-modification system, M subunit [Actinomadura verrucosospora]|uniref:site-specific DNA-methyltransferase (adenine-specific) n=1 Tax=Actinomadura verrucosospora TaxID=46165 RepID=A0A7D3ZSJ3_ACTVE|nr:Type I restriction-modification system, M subunit [Actinomadura verrucosospora]
MSELAGVRRETITTWASRHSDFPKARSSGGREYLHLPSVLAWLESRPIPVKSLQDGESEGATYADRIRRVLRERRPRERPARLADDGPAGRRLTELYGPLADRVRGSGPQGAYLYFLLALVTVQASDRRAWAIVRDLVAEADQQQRSAEDLLKDLARIVDRVLRDQGQMPGAVAAFEKLRPEASEDLAYVVRLCEGLGQEAFWFLLDRFEEWTQPDSAEFFTPRAVVSLMADTLCVDGEGPARCFDPHVRGGEGLAAAAGRRPGLSVVGESPSATSLQLAGMNLAFHGVEPDLRECTATPWDRPDRHGRKFDFVITNPPFNQKASIPRDRTGQDWPFGPPPARSDNYAWPQYIHSSLKPGGRAAVVMPNRAAVSDDEKERAIRGKMIEQGAVESVIWLPRGLFPSTPVAVTIWILTASSRTRGDVLLIDARKMGRKDGKRRRLSPDEWGGIVECHSRWKRGEADFAGALIGGGTAVSVSRETIRRSEDSLDPSDYAEPVIELSAPDALVPYPTDALGAVRRRADDADRVAASLVVRERAAGSGELPDGWCRVPLAELCDIQTGPTYRRLKAAPRSPDGAPIIVRGHLRDRRVVMADPDRMDREAARRFGRFMLEPDDILCVRTGATGPLALVGPEHAGCLFDSGLTRIRRSSSVDLDPWYLLAFLSLPATQNWIGNRAATATAIDSIGGKRLGHLLVTLPPLGEQQRIGAALRAMDDQIVAHRDLAEAAERTRAALATNLVAGPLAVG